MGEYEKYVQDMKEKEKVEQKKSWREEIYGTEE